MVVTGLTAGTVGALTTQSAEAASGTAAGRVFRDFNMNGVFDTTTSTANPAVDVGISGVTVRAYDSSNAVVGTGTTTSTGQYAITYNTTTTSTKVRLEFDTPTGMVASRAGISGSTNDSSVQFVSSGVTNADYAVGYPQDYAPANPTIVFARQIGAIKYDGTAQTTTAGTVFSNPYNTRGTTTATAPTTEATYAQTGSVWGTATLGSDYIFSSALLKRHAPLGPGGIGAVYVTTAGGSPDASVFATVANAGTDPRTSSQTLAQWFNDVQAYSSVGKISLGGMVMAPDNSALYVVNLNAKTLVKIPITVNSSGVPVAGTQKAIAIPSPSCSGTLRPFGVGTGNDALWVTQTCAATSAANLAGYVYKFDYRTDTFAATPAMTVPLTGARGFAYSGNNQSATWEVWSDSTGTDVYPNTATSVSNPQPLLSDISFDANGDMNIGIKDRFGDQSGFAGRPIAGDTNRYETMAAGDTVRACGGPNTWTLESNGSCGGRAGYGVGNGDGPGGGEFYSDDFNSGSHDQVSLGGMLQVPGFPHLINTTFDPKSPGGDSEYGTNGYRFWSNANGGFDATNGWRQVGTAARAAGELSTYGKAGGMGDLDMLVKTPVEIGNRVWIDLDRDGIQDPDEAPVSGVQVRLYNAAGTTVLATTTTSSTGEYYFNDSNYPAIAAGTSYVVKIDRASDYASGGALYGYTTTTKNAGSKDTIDSDVDMVSGFAQMTVTTPKFGADHSFDAGFVRKSVSVGDYVWVDADKDGIQDASEAGLPGVTVTITGPGGAAVTDVYGNAVTSTTTDAGGKYTFAHLPSLVAGQSYTVKIDNNQAALANFVPTTTGAGTAATDSSNGTAVSGDLVNNNDADTTLDFGFYRKAVSVGDFVWVDTNRNGVQDAGEPGLSGVTVTLVGPTGAAVTNVNGAAVGPVTTDAGGKYSFDLLPTLAAGQSYTVKIDNTQAALSAYVPTQTGQGTTATDSSNASAASVTTLTTNGASDLTLDFGFVKKAVSVGDFVWVDTNRDGIQDAGEPGIPGVTVTIVGPTGAAVTNVNGATVGPVTTDAGGKYSFDLLPTLAAGQSYTVKIDNSQAALSAYAPTLANQGSDTSKDSSNGSAASVTTLTTNGASDLTLDFGFVKKAVSVGDFVWVDTNRDGIQQAGEPGIPGVTVTIVGPTGAAMTNVNGATVGPVTTDAGGKYTFALLPALPAGQHYTVKIDNTQAALAAYVPTTAGAGSDTSKDSSTSTSESGNLTANGDSDLTLDFGFVKPAVSVGDFVWVDSNRNGVQDAGEPGIQGVTVTVVGPTGAAVTNVNGATVGPVTTDVNGAYSFTLLPVLPAGQSYTVKIDNTQAALSDYVPTQTGQGTNGTDSSNGSAVSGNLTSNGASDNSLDFGFFRKSVTVGDFVWVDTNRDGLQDAGEPGIPGVTVTLVGPTGNPVTNTNGVVVGAATTDSNGKYTFTNLPVLPAGQHYTVKVDNTQAALSAYVPTQANQGADTSKDSSTSTSESGNLTTNGASDLTLDFGFVKPAVSVGDYVWVDANKNGIQDSGETGLQGVTVTIVGPTGNPVTNVNGVTVGSTTTNASGAYSFGLLPVLPAGQSYTVKIDNTQAALADYLPTITGAGTAATDSSNGSAASGNLTTNGASDTTLDFGFFRKSVSVGDYVWLDTNRDGIQQAGESGIQGVVLTIVGPTGNAVTNINGVVVGSTTTNAAGAYSFTNLPALPAGQHYTVKVDNTQAALSAYVPTLATQGSDTSKDSSTSSSESGNLPTNGDSDLTLDFGFVKPAVSVGDFVWVDTNGNGIQNAGEPGLAGVTVTLVGPNGNPVTNVNGATVGPVVTDANGAYSFTLLPVLPAGQSYTVKIDNTQAALASYVPTQTGQGTNGTDSSNGSAVSGNLTTNGASDNSLDFGFVRKAVSVGDYVWLDTNRDGIQNASESGIAGVKLTIVGPTGNAVTDIYGNAVGAATTDANGKYLFGNLPALTAGNHYTVKVDNTQAALTAYVPTLANQGADTAKDSSTSTSESGNLPNNGDSDLTLDFGFVKPAVSVGDFVWVDTNGNGIQNAGEPGLPGVTVTIVGPTGNAVTDVNGSTVGPVVTDANGAYSFALLPALPAGQSYTVKIDNTQAALASYVPTQTGQGTAATDSSNGSAASGNLTTNGASDTTLDFGFVRKSVSVGDYVWLDTNRDGIQQGSETGISGVKLTIVGPTGNAVTDIYGAAVGAATTNAAGAYLFTNLPALPAGQHYTVKIDNTQAALAAYVPTITGAGTAATDSSNGSAESGNLPTNGDSDLTLDFGFVKPAVSVGDFVWVDTNGNGIQNAGEPGLAGVTVTIVGPTGNAVTNVNGATVGPVVTDAQGAYTFPLLPALPAGQSYTVKIDNTQAALADYVPTITGAGTAATDSSNGSAVSGNLATNGASDNTLDFGFVRKAVSVGDYVWLDTNRDGIQQASEFGIAGVKLTIVGPTGLAVTDIYGAAVGAATTNAAGAYSFTNLPALPAGQHYTVKIDNTQAALAAYIPTLANQGADTSKDSSTSSSESKNLPNNGDSDLTLDFGFVKPFVTVGDYVWLDTNRDGIQQAGESGIAGVKLTIVGPTGLAVTDIYGNAVGAATTNAAGAYTFTDLPVLPAGQHYTVKVDNTQAALSGYVPTLANQGADTSKDSSTSTSESGNLTTNGAKDLTLDFGFVKPAVSVGDFVWVDTNKNGIQDSGEPGLQGVTVTIVGPTGNAVTDVNGNTVGPVVTNAQGAYTFPLLPALPAGQSYTVKIDNTQAALLSYVPTITGAGNNGTDSSNGSAVSNDLTTNGASDNSLDFGFVPATPSIKLVKSASSIDDLDGNGPDAGDQITYGFVVTNTGNVTLTTVTVSDPKVGPVSCPSTPLAAGASRSCTSVVYTITQADVNTGAVNNTANVQGFAPDNTKVTDSSSTTTPINTLSVAVGDYVWLDKNRDGIQQPGETGIAAVKLTIVGPTGNPVTDVNGNSVGAATTDSDGKYYFGNLPTLPAGQHYTVKVDNTQAALAGYVPTLANQGTDTTKDSSTGSAESTNLTTNGAMDLTLDFGFVKPAVTVGDFVWVDTNGNGIQNPGEPGLAGVKVTIVGPGGNPVTDVNGNPVGAATTDANGKYSFELLPALPAGQSYTVKVDNTQAALTDYVPTQTGQGTPATDSSNGSATTGNLTTNGASDNTVDFGFVRKSVSVGDYVWLDTNRDGIQQAGESGIAGVKLTIVGPTGLAVTDIYGAAVGAATTNAAGAYSFTNLPALPAGQHYTVKIDNTQAALAAYVPTLANQGADTSKDSSTSSSESKNLPNNGDQDLTLDFGFVKPAVSVGDFVWVDTNGNGIQDSGEPGIQGVKLTIVGPTGNPVTDVNGNPVGAATTDSNGKYGFELLPVLPAGQSYTVKVDNAQPALAGYVPTQTGQGTPATDSSNGSGTTGNLTTNGASDKTIDFGFTSAAGSILLDKTASAIDDVDGNGPDAGDKITFSFKVTNTGNVTLNPVTVTDNKVGTVTCPTGALAPGDSVTCSPVTVTLTQADVNAGSYLNTATATGKTPAGDTVTSQDSTTTPISPYKVTVGDFVWSDTNGNGIQDSGEPGIQGVKLTIVGPDGNPVTDVFGNPVGAATTNGNGGYTFGNLPALPAGQHYTVKVDTTQPALAGYVPSPTGQGTPSTDSSNGSGETGNLTTNGASDTTIDFGFVPQSPAIELDKTASSINDLDSNGPDEGDTITYSFKVTNTGNATLTNIAVTDPMFASITCPTGPLAPNASVTCEQLTYTLTAADVAAGFVDNTAKATGTAPGGTQVNDTDSTHTPVVPVTGVANIKVNKTVDIANPHIGDTVTYTVTVTNDGDAVANDVVLKDVLPSGVTFVSASAPCTQNAGTVACSFGNVPAGGVKTVTIKAVVDNVPAGTTEERHGIDVQKAEAVLDLTAGQTSSVNVTCQPGYVVLDGSARIVHVDGGTGTLADVTVLENRATALDTWTATLKNNATGQAQNKVFALCVKKETETVNNHSHQLQVAATPVTQTVALPSGHSNVTLSCATGETPVQPGWAFDGAATVPTSYPSGASSWVFGVDNDGAGNGTFSIRCMKNQVSTVNGHNHDLALGELFKTVTIPAGQTVDVVLDCADSPLGNQGAKGIVAGYNLAPGLTTGNGLLHLGNEPQPVRRVFTLMNPTASDLNADLWLLCMGTRTAGHDGTGSIVNTATATTTSAEISTNDNSSSATITVTAAPVVDTPKADLVVSKTVDNTSPRVGDTVTYTLKVTNDGDAAAENVVLTDPLPNGVSYVSSSAPCTVNGSTVTCALGTVAAGATKTVTITATVDSVPAAGSAHSHWVDVQKAEAQVNLAAGETKTVDVDCGSGYLATDGSGRVDQIDQGTGTPDAVQILGSRALDEDTWSVTMANNATGNAQGKAFVVCVKKQTDEADGHTHALTYGAPVTQTAALTAGDNEVTLSCGPGTTPIQPGYSVPAGATVKQSYPVAGGWKFVVGASGAGSADLSIRCMNTSVASAQGHTHTLSLTPITQTAIVQPGQTLEVTSSCAGDAKGIVAGFRMANGLVQLGNDPRPIIRVMKFYNPTNTAKSVDVFLLCQGNYTSATVGAGQVRNTAYASTTTPETTTADNAASASFTVDTSSIAAPRSSTVTVSKTSVVSTTVSCTDGTTTCKGTVALVAAKTQKIDGKVIKKGTVLARTTFKITAGKVVKVNMKPTTAGKKALQSKSLKKAQVKIGSRTKSVTIRR